MVTASHDKTQPASPNRRQTEPSVLTIQRFSKKLNGAIYAEHSSSFFARFVEPRYASGTYTHIGVVVDRSVVQAVDAASVVPGEDWYVFSSGLRHGGIHFAPLATEVNHPAVTQSWVRVPPLTDSGKSSIDQSALIRVMRSMWGAKYDLRVRPHRQYVVARRHGLAFTCSSSAAYLVQSLGLANFDDWRTVYPPDFEVAELGGYGPPLVLL